MTQPNTDPLATIQERVRARLSALGISASTASRRGSIGLSYLNDLLSGKSKNPSVTILAKVGDVLECDLEYLLGFQAEPRRDKSLKDIRPAPAVGIPLYTVTMTEPDGFFPMRDEDVTAFVPFGSSDIPGVVYAVTVGDDMMAPRFMAGEIVCANMRKPVAVNSFVVVRLASDRAIIRQVRQINADTIELSNLRDESTEKVARNEVKAIHRIVATLEG